MFNSISGNITGKNGIYLFLENNGLEWQLELSQISMSKAGTLGDKVRIFTYLHHKEDQMTMYGFADLRERELFLNLISVSGIGPRGALKILSGMDPARFIQALETEDINSLSSIPGLGKKTAQKIVLQLRGKLAPKEEENEDESTENGHMKELLVSLTNMGFEKKSIEKVLKVILADPEIKDLSPQKKEEEVMRRAIINLSQGV